MDEDLNSVIKEKYYDRNTGINIFFTESIDEDHARSIVDVLNNIKSIFLNRKIKPTLGNLFKNLIIFKSSKEKHVISNHFKYSSNIDGVYLQESDTIIINVRRFYDNKSLLKVLVHEIAHSIHIKYIAGVDAENKVDSLNHSSSRKYYDTISLLFINLVKALSKINPDTSKKDIDSLKEKAEVELEKIFTNSESSFKEYFLSQIEKNRTKGMPPPLPWDDTIEKEALTKDKIDVVKDRNAILDTISDLFPTGYSLTNNFEDFAETFTEFILNYDNLNQWNKNRILNTLSISKRDGKSLIESKSNLSIFKNYVKIFLENYRYKK